MNDDTYNKALEELSKGPKQALLSAAKRNHNTALQTRDALLSLIEDRNLDPRVKERLSHVLEDVQAAEDEARAQLEVVRGLFGVSL